jgi:outer membrane receptor protein involved in Fe transport
VLGRDRIEWTTLHDLVVEYRLADGAGARGWRRLLAGGAVTLGVNNLLDRAGRYLPSGGSRATVNTDSTLGRTLWLRLRKDF